MGITALGIKDKSDLNLKQNVFPETLLQRKYIPKNIALNLSDFRIQVWHYNKGKTNNKKTGTADNKD